GVIVFADRNNNGRLDLGEVWTRSDSSGRFLLTGLAPGVVRLRVWLTTGQKQTTAAPPLTISSGTGLKGQLVGGRIAPVPKVAQVNSKASGRVSAQAVDPLAGALADELAAPTAS